MGTCTLLPSELRALLAYDASTGELLWRMRRQGTPQWNARYAGKPALTATDDRGYRVGEILHSRALAHRVAWAIHHGEWPTAHIDHISGDRTDNRMSNLRLSPGGENARNAQRSTRNKSGVTGVRWYRQVGKWHAQIMVDGRNHHLGFFNGFDEAKAAREAANSTYNYHPNHGRAPRIHHQRRLP